MQTHLKVGRLQFACQGGQKSALARPWGPQQQSHAARGNDGTHAVQDAEVLGGWLHQLQPQQQALQWCPTQTTCQVGPHSHYCKRMLVETRS